MKDTDTPIRSKAHRAEPGAPLCAPPPEGGRGAVRRLPNGRLLLLSLLFLVVSLGAGCGGDDRAAGRQGGELPVETAVARQDTLSIRVSSVGSLEANAIVHLRAEAEGVVRRILVDEGERVEAGDVLIRLDDRELVASRDAAEATLRRTVAEAENLRVRVRRNRDLLAKGAISEQTFDDLKTSLQLAEARSDEARANLVLAQELLENSVIRAPFDGRVGSRSFYLGDLIEHGSLLYTIVDDDTLKVEFSVPERIAGSFDVGSPVSIQVSSIPEGGFGGSVTFVSPVIDPESRTLEVKAVIPNREGRLRAGQFAEVALTLEKRPDAILLPETAIVPRSGENFVFIVQADTARRRSVVIGERREGLVEIRSGVGRGDTVVVAGQQRLRDRSPVRPAPAAEAGAGS